MLPLLLVEDGFYYRIMINGMVNMMLGCVEAKDERCVAGAYIAWGGRAHL